MKSLKLFFSLFAILIFTLVSCSKDDNNEDPKPVDESNLLLSSTVVNADGQSGSGYIQVISNLDEKTYDVKEALPFTFFHKPVVIGNSVYELPFFGSNSLTKYTKGDNGLVKSRSLSIEENSNPSGIVLLSDTKAYVTLYGKGKILVINPKTMEKSGEISIADYGVEDQNPDAAQMIIRGDNLFVALGQSIGGFFPSEDRPYADMLVIDTKTDKVIKMTTEKTTGLSTPSRPNDPQSIFMDENQDIYVTCIAAFGARPSHKTGFLRIKNGQTEFDQSWSLPIESITVDGNTQKVDYVQYSQYGGNGKLYAIVNIPALYSNPVNYLNDRTCVPVVIDLNTKSVTVIDELPKSNSYCSVTKYKDSIIFGLDGSESSGYFRYDLKTGKVSSNPVIKVDGAPTGLYSFQ